MLKKISLCLIKAYQLTLSPYVGQSCRFYPTCSNYATTAIKQHGFSKGCYLTLKRLAKCHPWHQGGFDHVPNTNHRHHTKK